MQYKELTKKDEKALLKILGAKHMDDILGMISTKSCSAHMLRDELNIPMGSAYRKLKILEDAKLIYLAKVIVNHSGNEEKYYGCLLDKATINYHDGTFSINVHKKKNGETIIKTWNKNTRSFIDWNKQL